MRSAILALFAFTNLGLAQTYNESGGLVVMEIENTASPLGLWQKQTALAGHSGTGYLQFLGNTYESGPATSPLEFNFKINQAGHYYLHLHCAKETHDGRTDVANDCYVRVEGDYNAGPNAGSNHGDDAPLSMLQSNTKYFGGASNNWKWENGQNSSGGAGNLDPGGHENKRVAVYDFKAGETYKLVVSGRSKFFRINRIVFRHTNTAAATAQNLATPESATITTSTSLIKPPPGRIAYVADGNSPDPDDIGANAVVFGLFAGSNLRDRLVHFSHSCDLNPFSNTGSSQSIDAPNELRRQNYLHQTAGEGIGFFGPFSNLVDYYNCRTEQAAAVNDLKNAINASSAADPLWIIEAGEPDIIGYALQAADANIRQFVHVISHHPANDNSGDFFTWAQILAFGVTEHQIGDQNVGLQVLISSGLWNWAENHPRAEIVWILDQLKYAEADGVVGFQTNKYDCSDAGMLYWWITGANQGGNKNSTPVEIKNMLLLDPDAPAAYWPLDEGSGNNAADASGNGHHGTLLNGATWGSDAIRDSYVSFDGTDDRIFTPFTYALSSSDNFTWAWWANQQSTGTTDDASIMVGNRYPQPGAGGQTLEFIKMRPAAASFADTGSAASIEVYDYANIQPGEWHHCAMVKNGTSYQWYVDGVAQGAPVTINYNESSPIPFFIGGDDDGAGRPIEHFQGFIDEVVLYRRALSAAEVIEVRDGKIGGGNATIDGVMQGLLNDTDVRSDGTLLASSLPTLVPGRSGASGGIDRSSVFVFQLPNLGSVANPFTAASFGFNVESVSTTPPGVDLYGLGKRASANVLASDYHGETASLDSTDATLIQNNILNGSTGIGFKNSNASSALAAYLNAQYESGLGAGSYVFLRLSTAAPITGLLRHFITSADAAGDNGPRISYTAFAPGDFDSWLGSFSFPPGADLSPGGDPDGDGLTTRFEYLFGLNPSDGGSVSPITSELSSAAGTFSYTRRNPALTGINNYQIWISENLYLWSHQSAATQTPDDPLAEVQDVEVLLNLESPLLPTLFVQVRAGG
jgi:hypothetical protein